MFKLFTSTKLNKSLLGNLIKPNAELANKINENVTELKAKSINYEVPNNKIDFEQYPGLTPQIFKYMKLKNNYLAR